MGPLRFASRRRDGSRCWVRRRGYLPAVGADFYGGATDVLTADVVLAKNTVRQEITVTATGIPTPLPQLTAPMTVIAGEALETAAGCCGRDAAGAGRVPGADGATGGVTSLFLRGGNSTANLVLIDGIPADDVGGMFDFGTVSSTAIAKIEVLRGPDSAMYGTDAGAGVIIHQNAARNFAEAAGELLRAMRAPCIRGAMK